MVGKQHLMVKAVPIWRPFSHKPSQSRAGCATIHKANEFNLDKKQLKVISNHLRFEQMAADSTAIRDNLLLKFTWTPLYELHTMNCSKSDMLL